MRSAISRKPFTASRDDDHPVSLDRGRGNGCAREGLELGLDFGADGLRHRIGCTEKKRIRGFVVLGLREEVRSDPARVGLVVRDDEDLARSGDRVDADDTAHETLRARDVEVARAHDLVDAANRGGAVSEGGDGLRAPCVEDARDAREVRRGEQGVVGGIAVERRREHDVLHAGHVGRNRAHENARRITRLAAGRVDAHPSEWARPPAEHDAVRALLEGRLGDEVLELAMVKRANTRGGKAERFGVRLRQALERLRAAFGSTQKGLGTPLVESLRVTKDGCVSVPANGVEDLANRGFDGGEIGIAAAVEPGELLVGRRRPVVHDSHDARALYHGTVARVRVAGPSVVVLLWLVGCPSTPSVKPTAQPCTEGFTVVLGACVPYELADAFCGRAARPEPGGGCATRACASRGGAQSKNGLCLPASIGRHLLTQDPEDSRLATCASGRLQRSASAASLVCAVGARTCRPGERYLKAPIDAGVDAREPPEQAQGACEALPPCGAGELFDEVTAHCTRVKRAVVDVGTWARIALGPDGGEGSNAFCAPIRDTQPESRFRIGLAFPDNDISQLSARIEAASPSSANDVGERSLAQLAKILRYLGGVSSAASVTLEVVCTAGAPLSPTLEQADAGR